MTRSSEDSIHKAILAYLRLRFPRGLVVHAANELNLAADARSKAIAQARAKSLGMMPGWPDLMLLTGDDVDGRGNGIPGTGAAYFFEVKAQGGRVSPAQKGVLDALNRLGFRAAVVRSVRDVEECLAEWDVDGANHWQSIGNVTAKLQQRLAKQTADARNKSGPSGVGSTDTALTIATRSQEDHADG